MTDVDHLVLRCRDVEVTLAWYLDEIGLAPVRVDEWRAGGAPFPSVRVSPTAIIDLVPAVAIRDGAFVPEDEIAGGHLDHVCLVVEPTDLGAIADSGRFTVVDGPDTRYGARGDGTSLYILDPDGCTVELRHY